VFRRYSNYRSGGPRSLSSGPPLHGQCTAEYHNELESFDCTITALSNGRANRPEAPITKRTWSIGLRYGSEVRASWCGEAPAPACSAPPAGKAARVWRGGTPAGPPGVRAIERRGRVWSECPGGASVGRRGALLLEPMRQYLHELDAEQADVMVTTSERGDGRRRRGLSA
jgi:hypothetical protein